MMKKILSMVLSMIFVFALSSTAAVYFSDVTSDSHPWAINEISEMADKKIINGYPDGTFMPNQNVTKQEALLMISRILGYSTSQTISDYMNSIYKVYEADLTYVDTDYKREMAFLSFYGVFQTDELSDISMNAPLTREEAAYYITKTMKKQSIAVNFTIPNELYADDNLISSFYRPYVYYVQSAGYMTGSGEDGFTPVDNITRAQMAVLLYRVMNKVETSFSTGVVDSVSASKNTANLFVNGATQEVDSDALIRNRGKEISISNLYKKIEGVVTLQNDEIIQFDAFFDELESVNSVDGEVKSTSAAGGNSLKLKDPDTTLTETYELVENCKIFVNGNDATFANVRTGDYVTLELDSYGRAVSVTVEPVSGEISDVTITDIIITDTTTSLVVENSTGTETVFEINANDLVVKKNGNKIDITSLFVGDTLSKITLKYGRAVSIDAYSTVKNTSGTITEILISSTNSSITILDGNTSNTYAITRDTKIYVFGEIKTIYDLQLSYKANLTLDGTAVSKIEVSTQAQTGDAKGIVQAVNTSYGFFTIKDADGNSTQIFVSSTKTKIIDNTSSNPNLTKTIKDIKAGQAITAIGTIVNGAFEAQTVVITN